MATCECGCGEETTIAKRTRTRLGHVKGQPLRFVNGHSARAVDPWHEEDRGYETPCWIWHRATDRDGYGVTRINYRQEKAHRVSYERHVGPIPAGLVIDHLCRQHSCVNPRHLEPVTPGENRRRGRMIRLSPSLVISARMMAATTTLTQKEIADVLGLPDYTVVGYAIRGDTWRLGPVWTGDSEDDRVGTDATGDHPAVALAA